MGFIDDRINLRILNKMILNSTKIKKCNKCRATGNKEQIKTYSFMCHFPFYDYDSFYLCDKCFKELEQILINFLEPSQAEQEVLK